LKKLKDKVSANDKELRDLIIESLKKPSSEQIYQVLDHFCPTFEDKIEQI
jgi:uncharacterized protein YneF (UPF0154 family)